MEKLKETLETLFINWGKFASRIKSQVTIYCWGFSVIGKVSKT